VVGSLNPLQSYEGERDDEKNSVICVSSTFSPGSHKSIPDTIFRSSDAVLFYVNSQILLRVTNRAFEPILHSSLEEYAPRNKRNNVINLPDNSAILDVILHVFYNISLFRPSPPQLEVLEVAVSRMNMYGLVPSSHITPSTPPFDALYSHAQLGPHIAIRVYALAGQYSLHSLATQTSPHLLSYTLSDLSDDLVKRMGAKYLRRLMSLHLTRVDELKRIIIRPPHTHPTSSGCSMTDQKSLARAWALAASYLTWDTRPGEFHLRLPWFRNLTDLDITSQSIRSTFSTLNEHIFCNECRKAVQQRIKEVVVLWLEVKVRSLCFPPGYFCLNFPKGHDLVGFLTLQNQLTFFCFHHAHIESFFSFHGSICYF